MNARVCKFDQVHLREVSPLVDHVQRRRVVDRPSFNLHVDVVGVPHRAQLRQGTREEVPLVHHAVHFRVRTHVLHRRRRGVRVDAKQFYVCAGGPEQALRVDHLRRRQRAHRRALRVVERKHHDMARERVKRDLLAELVREREVRCLARERSAAVEVRIARERRFLRTRGRRGAREQHDRREHECEQCERRDALEHDDASSRH